MESTIGKLRELLSITREYWESVPDEHLEAPIAQGKWSKKEILGHLTDSALHNLVRFTEIGYQPQPYLYREYNQKELTTVNHYQTADKDDLLELWLALNKQIIRVIENINNEKLALTIASSDPLITDLRSIVEDYPLHMAHHINQILNL